MKKIILSSFMVGVTTWSVAQTRVLYYLDYTVGPDAMETGLIDAGCLVTSVSSNYDFQTELATPANYDIAIYLSQNYGADGTSVNALANFVSLPNKKGIYFDYTGNNTYAALLGANYNGAINQTVVTVTDPELAAGLPSNPFTLVNTGWGVFSNGVLPLPGGTVPATFASGDGAIVRSMDGNMMVLGFCADLGAPSYLYTNIIEQLVAEIATSSISGTHCQGDNVNVDFTSMATFTTSNVFTAELSDATGSFASPTAIGTLSGDTPGTISATIPAITAGTGYRIRVVSSDPAITGTDNGTDLTINESPVVTASTPSTNVCNGATATVTVSATGGLAPYTGAGTFTQTAGTTVYMVTDDNGCSSSESVIITENAAIDITTSTSGITITATATPATYQWLDCNNSYAVIAGATNQDFTATANGNYAVEITESGCKDTSACVAITTVGIQGMHKNTSLAIYPNPVSTGFFNMNAPASGNMHLLIIDAQGKAVVSMTENVTEGQNTTVALPGITNGLYFVQVNIGNIFATEKLVIE